MKRQLLYLFVFLTIYSSSNGQKATWEIGGKLINEIANGGYYAPGLGVQTIFRFSKHSAIESGLFYKINPQYYYHFVNYSNTDVIRYNEKVIQVPLIYRFDTRLANLSAGFFFNYLTNKMAVAKRIPAGNDEEYFTRIIAVATIGISKSWELRNHWIIEPELRFSAPIPQGGVGTGFNISLRKRLAALINSSLK